jgi:hypothetical protein
MSLNPFEPPKPAVGDYVCTRGCDSEEQREDARQQLQRAGCKRFRVENLDDGRITVHGYLRA